MGVSILDEDSNFYESEFVAFDESGKSRITAASNVTLSTTGSDPGIDTREIDAYRQGVEITTNTHRFTGTGAKVWSGHLKGYTKAQTIGQSVSFTEFEGTRVFEETLSYDPLSYVSSSEEVYFGNTIDDMPVENLEAIMMPFTITNRSGLNKGIDPQNIRGVRGNLEDGNESYNGINTNNSKIEQFITFNDPKANGFFDDLTHSYLVTDSTENKIERLEGNTVIIPFNDLSSKTITSKVNTTNSSFITLLNSASMDINLDEDIRQTYNRASATAGYSVYSANGSEIGTDSIAFNGFFKGN